jgi:hypothetical protein
VGTLQPGSLAYGQNIFAENNTWGLLCFDLEGAEGDVCPVLWLHRGKLHPWAGDSGDLLVDEPRGHPGAARRPPGGEWAVDESVRRR